MNRIKGILAAGTLTGLILATMVAFGFQRPSMGTVEETAVAPEIIINPIVMPEEKVNDTNQVEVQELESYTQQLETALQTMQERESAFQAQINQANQTIIALQDQVNAQIDAQAAEPIFVQAEPTSGDTYEHDEDRYEHDDDDEDEHDEDDEDEEDDD